MKKNFNTLNEQMLRMKSLFTEERLYGNLIIEQDPNSDTPPQPAKNSKNPPTSPTGDELKKQGYVDTLPDGEDKSVYEIKTDNEGKEWYKLKAGEVEKRAKLKKDNTT